MRVPASSSHPAPRFQQQDGALAAAGWDDQEYAGRCPVTGQPCQLEPLPAGSATEVLVTFPVAESAASPLSPPSPLSITVTHMPAVRCTHCGVISFDLDTLLVAEEALERLVREGADPLVLRGGVDYTQLR